MSSLTCRVAALAISFLIAPGVGAAERPLGSAAAAGWGFDLAGANFARKPGDDFFRHGNGAWYDRALIPRDRSAIGVDTALAITAEGRIRDILERGADGVDPSGRADAVKFGAFYTAFMDEALADRLDAEPSAPLLEAIRFAQTREELAA